MLPRTPALCPCSSSGAHVSGPPQPLQGSLLCTAGPRASRGHHPRGEAGGSSSSSSSHSLALLLRPQPQCAPVTWSLPASRPGGQQSSPAPNRRAGAGEHQQLVPRREMSLGLRSACSPPGCTTFLQPQNVGPAYRPRRESPWLESSQGCSIFKVLQVPLGAQSGLSGSPRAPLVL